MIEEILHASLKRTGYEEVSLLSLSAGDYSLIGPLLSHLMDQFESKRIAVSFPSLRIESIVGYLAEEVKRVRKTGFTIVPEAGTDRLRRVINKELDEAILFQGLASLFSKGWKNLKLYFMIGLPTERDEDLRGIVDLAKKISSLGEKQKTHPNLNVSISTFVPKPHTPFQWESQIPIEEIKERLRFLKEELKQNHLRLKWQDPNLSCLEAIFSTGDRNLSRVLVEAHRLGCRFDGWSDQFHHFLWKEAFETVGLGMNLPARKKEVKEMLPWSFIQTGVGLAFLWEEYQKGLKGEISPPCIEEECHRCGVCNGHTLKVRGNLSQEVGFQERIGGIQKKGIKKKIRLGFKKVEALRFLSHLELAHLFYRASKRTDLPLCYSQGFHPMPKIIFATALPVGVESRMEIVDMELEGRITPNEVMESLNQALPEGILIIEAKEVPLSSKPSSLRYPSTYWISLDHLLPREEAVSRIEMALEKKELLIHQERKGKKRKVDIRPLIQRMGVTERDERLEKVPDWGIDLVLRQATGRSAKPSEILEAILGLKGEALAQCRIIKME